ncbi:MAG: crossover junction endodeoxyribonuclease RuvC [Myxococcota bacterium]|jgi:crossover junction endodeoxyribonuclease RuvC
MVVFGIDPGSVATGYAAVHRKAGRYILLEAGVIRTRVKEPIPMRLLTIHTGLTEALARLKPDEVAIEAIFRHRSSESALRLGQARGVALLAVAQYGLDATPYNPMTVKKSVGGHGGAGKAEMVRIVSRLVGRTEPLPSDAADATAIAITHLVNATFNARLEKARGVRPS